MVHISAALFLIVVFPGYRTKRVGKNLYYACIKGRILGILKYARAAL